MPWPQLFFALFGVASPLVPAPQRSPRTLLQKPSSQPTLRWRGESRANSSRKWISGARKKSDFQRFLDDSGLLKSGFARSDRRATDRAVFPCSTELEGDGAISAFVSRAMQFSEIVTD